MSEQSAFGVGGNLDTIREMNISAVLRLIQRTEGLSRTDLSRLTGLKQATITKILAKLIGYGLVKEKQNSSVARGRPPISIELDKNAYSTVGLNVARGDISACVCNIGGEVGIVYEDKYSTESSEDLIQKAIQLTSQAISSSKAEPSRLLGIGIASPRCYGDEKESGIIVSEALSKAFSLPVFDEHDAVCGALNEYLFESVTKPKSLCYIANYKGVGAAFLFDGVPYLGSGKYAGEIGHMTLFPNGERCRCGNNGCLEMYCSTTALEKYYGGFKEAEEILALVNKNDRKACEAFDRVCSYLSIGIVNIVRTVNPEEIVISDKLAIAHKRLYDRITSEVYSTLRKNEVRITVRRYSKTAILKGANAYVLSHALNEPEGFFNLRKSADYTAAEF